MTLPSTPLGRALSATAAALVGLALSTADAHAATPGATVETVAPCFVSPTGIEWKGSFDCGYVVVPQNRALRDGPSVKLGFLRLQTKAAKSAAPLFMLSGGPGGSLIQPAAFLLFNPELLGALLDTRDVVILDQRGTAHAVPFLDCPGYHSLAWNQYSRRLGEEAKVALEREVLDGCIREFRRQGVDFSTYNSVAIAADVNDARRALGYDRIVYYGASYGAQLGQHVMRDHPAMLEAVILDGANSLSRKSWIEDRALDVDYAIRHLTSLCEADPKCRAAYDIPALIDRGLSLFDDGPIPVVFSDPKDPSTTLKFDVRREDFVTLIYEKQGYKIGVMSLPWLLNTLVKDGRASMAAVMGPLIGEKLLAQRNAKSGGLATLMHYAVVCSDDPVRSEGELVLRGVRSRYPILFGQSVAREYVRACRTIGVSALPDSTDVDVTTAVPTLILSGGLDAQTPTFRSEVVARSLPNARLVVFPDGTHVQVGAINRCAMQIIVAFVADPAKPLPLDCVDKSPFPGFLLPDGTTSRQ
jgi:pimeloyl-ACP methyl ester carboxylesterase